MIKIKVFSRLFFFRFEKRPRESFEWSINFLIFFDVFRRFVSESLFLAKTFAKEGMNMNILTKMKTSYTCTFFFEMARNQISYFKV